MRQWDSSPTTHPTAGPAVPRAAVSAEKVGAQIELAWSGFLHLLLSKPTLYMESCGTLH